MIKPLKASLLGVLATFLLSAVTPAQDPTNRNQDVVEMGKLEVFANRYKWRYARTDDFEILSALDDDKLAGDIVQKALQIISVFKAHSPLFHINNELPTKIILIKDYNVSRFITAIDEKAGAKIEADSRIKSSLIAQPEIQGLKSGSYSPNQTISILVKSNAEQAQVIMYVPEAYKGNSSNYFAVSRLVDTYFRLCLGSQNAKLSNLIYTFLSAKILALDSSERSFTPRYASTEIRTPTTVWYSLARSGVLIRRYDYKSERGIFQNAAFDYDKSKNDALSNFMAAPALALRDVLEYPDMFRISYNQPNSMQVVENYITYKREISDFSIYCVFSPDEQIRAGYVKLLNAVRKEPLSEDLFIRCFGRDYEDFYDGMYAFYRSLGRDNYTGKANAWGAPQFTIPFPKDKPPSRLDFRDATRGARSRVFGEWFMACKAPELAREIYAKAQEPDSSANTDPEFLASLGLYEAHTGDKIKALPLLEKAAALGTTRPAAYLMLTRLRIEDLKAKNTGTRSFLTEEIEHVAEPVETALKIPRHGVITYTYLALAWRIPGAKPPDAVLQTLTDACLANPDDFTLLKAVIPLLRKNGRQDSADKVLEATANCVLSDEEATMLEKLRQGTPLPPAATALDDAPDSE